MTDPNATSTAADANADRAFDAVLFDFGGVFTQSPFEHLMKSAESMGVDMSTLMSVVFGPYSMDTDHPWHRLERGELTLEDAVAQIKELGADSGIVSDPWEILLGMAGGGTRDYMIDVLRIVRERGLGTAIVTNNLKEFADQWTKMIPMEFIDVVSDSSVMGVRKPNPAIYEATLQALGVAAERAIFIDDAPGNVEAAAALGIHSILIPHDDDGARAAANEILSLTAPAEHA